MNVVKTYWNDFIALLFPNTCASCTELLTSQQNYICSFCETSLPYTNEDFTNHYLADKLMAIQPVSGIVSALYYHPNNTVGALLDQFKYKQRRDLGTFLGQILAKELLEFELPFDTIVPVPLHPTKQAKRGYNQAELLAREISRQINVPIDIENFIRIQNTTSQTKKSRQQRYETMQDVFQVKEPNAFQGKSILLIDDVITTGATMLSCAEVLFNADAEAVAFATVAKPYPF